MYMYDMYVSPSLRHRSSYHVSLYKYGGKSGSPSGALTLKGLEGCVAVGRGLSAV